MEAVNTFIAQAKDFLQTLTPVHWAIIGSVFFLLILIPLVRKASQKGRLRKFAPIVTLESFQISPLGRDAFFKIRNNGEQATLVSLFVRGRRDIVFKNSFVGHELHREKSYSILMEASAKDKIEENFTLELNYLDKMGNVYKQIFDLNHKTTKQPKLIKAK